MESPFIVPDTPLEGWRNRAGAIGIYELDADANIFRAISDALLKILQCTSGEAAVVPSENLVPLIIGSVMYRLSLRPGTDGVGFRALASALGLYVDTRRYKEGEETKTSCLVALDDGPSPKYVGVRHWEAAGGFSGRLGLAWAAADSANREKLENAFPELVRRAQIEAVLDGSYSGWVRACAS